MRNVIGVITARMTSTRLPGKVMHEIAGKTNFAHHVERMKSVKGLDRVCLATSKDPKNKVLIKEAERLDCSWYAGAEQDLLERHIKLCERENADAVIRVTCDCPLFNIEATSRFVAEFKKEYRDFIYCSNMTIIQGTLSELISYSAMLKMHESYRGPGISMPIRENMSMYNTLGLEIDIDLCRPEYRLTVDEPADLNLIRHIYDSLYKGKPLSLYEVYTWLDDNPEIAQINMNVGIKGCNQYGANLMEKPEYSIVKSGKKFVILDSQKRYVNPMKFVLKLAEMFPETEKKTEKHI
ncbi:MAG: hypothetical protein WC626_03480 [Methanoregula sp.]